jgi:hypothetical protein
VTLQIGDRKSKLERSLIRYYSELPVVPIKFEGKNKIPLEGWKYGKWKDGGQSEEDRQKAIELFERGECDGLAIVCGTPVHKDGERLYFFAIDIDLPAEEAARTLGKAGIITRFEQTMRGRLHAYFFSRSPTPHLPDMIDPETKEKVLEFKGYGSLIVVYPSEGYTNLNDNQPKTVDDALEVYSKICEVFGFDLEKELQQWARGPRETVTDSVILSEWLEQIVEELQRRGLKPRRGANYYSALCPFHEEKHPSFAINHRKFYAIDYHDGEVYNMRELAKALGLQLVTEPEIIDYREKREPRLKTKFTVGGERLPDGTWVEVVEKDGTPHLLIYKDGVFKVVKSYETDGVIYRPRPRLLFALPKAPERLEEDPTLWEDTKAFVKEHFDVPDERAYDIIIAAIAWSYFYRAVAEKAANASTPYLQFLGPWGSGKTRALDVFRAVAHRAYQVVNPSEAAIFRMIEVFKPTLVIDEANVFNPNILAIMAAGYRKGQFVPRADREDPYEVHLYDVFSFIIYATREQIRDDIFSRSVTIYCEKAIRPMAKLIDENRAAELRTRWFAQYLRLRDQVRVTYTEYESEDGRLQELFSPLLVMARLLGNPDAEKNIESYGREIEERIRGLETASDEAAVVEAIVKVISERPRDAPEYLLTSDIVKKMTDGEGNGPDPRWVGRIMHELGFAKIRISGGKRGYKIDYNLLNRLVRRYNITWTLPLSLGLKPEGGSSPSTSGREHEKGFGS